MNTNSVDFFKQHPYQLPEGVKAPVLVVCPLQTPENYGNIIRLADTIGCSILYVLKGSYPISERKIKKTAGNSYHRVNMHYVEENELFALLKDQYTLVGLETASNSRNIFHEILPVAMALIVGNEKQGIPPGLLEKCHLTVHIPLTGNCTSLNVTHALAVALFEWLRSNLE